ncbi:MAG: haloacid dehalogenase-like hydrolase [Caulobacter sp.]|nr:haloacid dehalogenase-like hydrolase [Caulobacter sp.]
MFLSNRRAVLVGFAASWTLAAAPGLAAPTDPLPSWNTGPAKTAITAYVGKVTGPGPDFVPPAERIAVFDNDGTLWAEQPIYFQFAFAMERIGQMVAKDPSLRQKPAFAAIADRDQAAMAKLSEKDLVEAVFAVQIGLTTREYQAVAKAWLDQARHPRFHMPYTALTYQPQLELLAYLRAYGFKTYIVSGGEVQFMRTFAEQVYGVPPEQVIGTSMTTKFELREGKGVLVAQPALASMDDGPGKPANIDLHIGRAPLVAVGNSDGDLEMLQYSASSQRPNLQILIHHDDGIREYAYDRQSKIGKLDKALDEAGARGWTVVSMKSDWKTVFAAKP